METKENQNARGQRSAHRPTLMSGKGPALVGEEARVVTMRALARQAVVQNEVMPEALEGQRFLRLELAHGRKQRGTRTRKGNRRREPARKLPRIYSAVQASLILCVFFYFCVVNTFQPSQMSLTPIILQTRKDSEKFIAKVVRKKCEQKFYRMKVEHSNIIKARSVIRTSDWHLVILPELVSLHLLLEGHVSGKHKLVRMSHDLARGVQFLHDSAIAHMDIKPHNLVFHPQTFVLQIIDFNSCVFVQHADEMISGRRGTEAWMAPGWYLLYIFYASNITLILFCRSTTGDTIQPGSG